MFEISLVEDEISNKEVRLFDTGSREVKFSKIEIIKVMSRRPQTSTLKPALGVRRPQGNFLSLRL